MKRILACLLLNCALFGQTIYHSSVTFTLDSTASQAIYVPYPPVRGGITSAHWTGISTSALTSTATSSKLDVYSTTGDVFVQAVIDTLTKEESDSLVIYMTPYTYSELKDAWYASTNDTTFLVFDTKGTYTATSKDYLDWSHGLAYTCQLSGETWANSGLQFVFEQTTTDTKGAALTMYFDVYIVVEEK